MKKSIFMAGLAALIFAGCGPEDKVEKRVILFPNRHLKAEWAIKRAVNGDTLLHGVSREYFKNGDNKSSVVWKNGKKDGPDQAWYEGGITKWQKSFEAGSKTGTWHLYYKDEHPWMVLNYVNHTLNGAAQAWDENNPDTPREAVFANGVCVSGDCGILTVPTLDEKALTPAEKTEMTEARETLQEFLE